MSGQLREKLEANLISLLSKEGKKLVKNVLDEYGLPERLLSKIIDLAGVGERICSEVRKDERKALVTGLCELDFEIERIGDFTNAMVTRGGVPLSEVNPKTMESRIVNNLFFAGEVLDFDGETGGYNLQAAFSTGYVAGKTINARTSRVENR